MSAPSQPSSTARQASRSQTAQTDPRGWLEGLSTSTNGLSNSARAIARWVSRHRVSSASTPMYSRISCLDDPNERFRLAAQSVGGRWRSARRGRSTACHTIWEADEGGGGEVGETGEGNEDA
eukprot:scaffold179587_cov29-Tisochrysis_lutea.AAC.6